MIRKTFGIKITSDNIYPLVTFAARHKLNLRDLVDEMRFNAKKGLDTFIVLDRNMTERTQSADVVTEMEFFSNWKFHNGNTVTVTALDFFQEVKAV